MNRIAKILSAVDPSTQSGIEIGALDKAIVTRDMGTVLYVDHAWTNDLRDKYKDDPNVDTGQIVDVDHIWEEATLQEAIGADQDFDYVIASHVIEHVPDIVGWLKEISDILCAGGVLSLAIPDKRYTFDYNRQLSTCGDVIDAYLRGLRRPSFKHIFDHYATIVQIDPLLAWSGLVCQHKLVKYYSEQAAIGSCQQASTTDQYIDVHCWIFTPESFFDIIRTLINLDLFDYKVVRFYPTRVAGIEFFVSLEKLPHFQNPVEKRQAQLNSLPTFRPPRQLLRPALHATAMSLITVQRRLRSRQR